MAEASMTPDERARKTQALVLRAVSRDSTQKAIAAAMGVSESTMTRMVDDHLSKFCLMLAHAGLQIVGNDVQTFSREQVQALLTLARAHLQQIEHPEDLS